MRAVSNVEDEEGDVGELLVVDRGPILEAEEVRGSEGVEEGEINLSSCFARLMTDIEKEEGEDETDSSSLRTTRLLHRLCEIEREKMNLAMISGTHWEGPVRYLQCATHLLRRHHPRRQIRNIEKEDDEDDDGDAVLMSPPSSFVENIRKAYAYRSGVLAVGDRIEARIFGDMLYYTGVILGQSEDRRTVSICYEDDDMVDSIPVQWVEPLSRKVVYDRKKEVRVLLGRYAVEGYPRFAYLLVFRKSPQLYQSAALLVEKRREGGSESADTERVTSSTAASGYVLDPSTSVVPFEVNQCFLILLALLHDREEEEEEGEKEKEEEDEEKTTRSAPSSPPPPSFLVIGCGGGAVPLGIKRFTKSRAVVDVVDLSDEILYVAKTYFGLDPESSKNIRLHKADGIEFLRRKFRKYSGATEEGPNYDAILLDVAAHDAVDGAPLEMPPADFIHEDTLRLARDSLRRDGGICAINVIANREMLHTIVRTCAKVFDQVAIFGVDPNYVFFCRRGHGGCGSSRRRRRHDNGGDGEETCRRSFKERGLEITANELSRKIRAIGLGKMVPEILGPFLDRSEIFKAQKIARGWMSLADFERALCDPDYGV
eukprot:g2027.t1